LAQFLRHLLIITAFSFCSTALDYVAIDLGFRSLAVAWTDHHPCLPVHQDHSNHSQRSGYSIKPLFVGFQAATFDLQWSLFCQGNDFVPKDEYSRYLFTLPESD